MSSRDPLHPGQRESNLGGVGLKRGGDPELELADVVAYNSATHTALLRTHRGRPLRDVPQIKLGPGEYIHLKLGTTVVVTYGLGFPAILGVMEMPGPPQDALAAPSLTGVAGVGNDDPLQPVSGSHNYRPPTAPTDMTQGDRAWIGTLGNHLAVLEGGVTSMGTPTAGVRSLGLIGLLQLIAQRMSTITDFGEWRVENDSGRTSFILRAGSTQTTQTGLDEQHWTIRLDMGATGDLFNFQITEPQGRTLFKLHVEADGRTQLYGDAGVDISSGAHGDAESRHDIQGSRATAIAGNDVTTVDGKKTTSVGDSHTENVTVDKNVVVGNNLTEYVNADHVAATGGKKTEIVAGGNADSAVPGNTAYALKVVNGDLDVAVGDPADGASPVARPAVHVRAAAGDITLRAGRGMKLLSDDLNQIDGSLVTVGGDQHPMPKWNDFLADFGGFLQQLLATLSGGVGFSRDQLLLLPVTIALMQEFAQKVSIGAPYESVKARNG